MLRADDLLIGAATDNALSGRITDSLYRGNRTEYVVELAAGAGVVHVDDRESGAPIDVGREVRLGIEPHKIHLLAD
jgi:ABC-type Fe3+/spermidine/putrescine transport system ATPase subunit